MVHSFPTCSSLGIDRFTDTTGGSDGAKVVVPDMMLDKMVEDVDDSGSSIEAGNLALLDGLPAGWGRVNGGRAEDGGEEGSVYDVTGRMRCEDALMQHTYVWPVVESTLATANPVSPGWTSKANSIVGGSSKEITTSGIDDTLWFTSGSRGLRKRRFQVRGNR